MTILQAFIKQLLIFWYIALYYCTRFLLSKKRMLNFLTSKKWWVVLLFMWFGVGTWARYHYQFTSLADWYRYKDQ